MEHEQLSPRKKYVLRHRQSEENVSMEKLPVSWMAATSNRRTTNDEGSKISRYHRHPGLNSSCGLLSCYHPFCIGKPSRKSGIFLFTISLMTLWNFAKHSLAWQQKQLQQVAAINEDTSIHKYKPKDSRVGVYPRIVQFLDATTREGPRSLQILSDYNATMGRQLTDHLPTWKLMELYKQQQQLEEINEVDSRDAEFDLPDPFETAECKAQYAWQLTTYPTCNTLHELDMTRLNSFDDVSLHKPREVHSSATCPPRLKYIASGYWRDIWSVNELVLHEDRIQKGQQQQPSCDMYYNVALKTMRYEHEFVGRNYDRHRRDALAAERLTKSDFVVDIYGLCGNSGLFEYSDAGDIANAIWPARTGKNGHDLAQIEKLQIATQAASGLADFHNIDREGRASMAHTDISPGQFIKIGHRYKLNDFNRARFLRWNVMKNEACGYYVDRNPGRNRSPEEYNYRLQSEKVDVYSLGNIFYMLLQKDWPFREMEEKEAKRLVKEGFRPSFDARVWNSTDPIDIVLKEAMIMSHEQAPEERASARQIETYLKQHLQNYSGRDAYSQSRLDV